MWFSPCSLPRLGLNSSRIIRPGPALAPVPGVTQLVVILGMAGRRDVQGFAGGQLLPGHDHVQLGVALVLVPDPQNVVLVGIEAGERQGLEIVHDLTLLFVGRCVFRCKGDHAGCVPVFVLAVVNQRPSGVGIAPQHLRGRFPPLHRTIDLDLLAGQVLGRPTATTTASRKKFNQHQRPPACAGPVSDRPGSRQARAPARSEHPTPGPRRRRICTCSPIGQSG